MNLAQQKDEHIGELTLRRRRAGEALGSDGPAIEAHATSCADCRARIRALDDEQRRFEQEISFDRFAAGVERAARSASKAKARRLHAEHLGRADAGDGGVRGRDGHVRPAPGVSEAGDAHEGGAGIIVRVAGVDGQRNARVDSTEPLARGERLRIGYQSGPPPLPDRADHRRARRRPGRCRPSRARAWRCPTARRERDPLPARQLGAGRDGRRTHHRRAVRSADRRRDRASAPRAPPTTRRAATSRACPAWTCRASNSCGRSPSR